MEFYTQNTINTTPSTIFSKEYTKIIYNQAYTNNPYNQNFLQNRISYTQTKNQNKPTGTAYEEIYQFYDYDIHGNIQRLINKQKAVSGQNTNYTSILKYDYHLISGNVKQVSHYGYLGETFHLKYTYDQDNRLTAVYSSRDSLIWDKDASYDHYVHGPLRSTIIGEDKIQNLDYVYTIEGNLKSINHPSFYNISGNFIMNFTVPRDLFGMTLHYYEGDYNPNKIPYPKNNQDFYNLYNGNIAGWSWNHNVNLPQSEQVKQNALNKLKNNNYHYDKLNRLREVQFTESQTNTITAIWNNNNSLKSSYDYDANGNLLNLSRNNYNPSGGTTIDQLSYHYQQNTNKLLYISDAINTLPNTIPQTKNDIKNQQSNNYTYDADGRLKTDQQEHITDIQWSHDNKILKVTKTGQNQDTIISYTYDGMGNRISKHLKITDNQNQNTTNTYTYYVRDIQGNILSMYEKTDNNQSIQLKEQMLYGIDLLGTWKPSQGISNNIQPLQNFYSRKVGDKQYNIKDHLGNIRVTFSDIKTPTNVYLQDFLPETKSVSNYYAFGWEIEPLSWSIETFKFGFNGKEKDGDITGGALDFGARIYSAKIGRWLSIDRAFKSFPSWSPYNYVLGNPINLIDPDGNAPGDPPAAYYFNPANKSLAIILLDDETVEWSMTEYKKKSTFGWNYIAVRDLRDAADFINKYKTKFKDSKPKSLYIQIHGAGGGSQICTHLGDKENKKKSIFTNSIEKYLNGGIKDKVRAEQVEALQTVISVLDDNGVCVFGTCRLGMNQKLIDDIKTLTNAGSRKLSFAFNQDLTTWGINHVKVGEWFTSSSGNKLYFQYGWKIFTPQGELFPKKDLLFNIKLGFGGGVGIKEDSPSEFEFGLGKPGKSDDRSKGKNDFAGEPAKP